MAQKLNYPKSESELQTIVDTFFTKAKEGKESGRIFAFKGLLEIINSDVVILTAIHNIKGNQGSQTPGSDGENMQEDILKKDYNEVIERVKSTLINYKPRPVRRVFIPKPGTSEKRPLGIPSIIDRIIQECVRIVIEPIVEAQFFAHSYGFRPMRSAQMAIERTTDIVRKTGCYWVVEGDISKFFDNVNHRILLKKLWGMGIRDKRVLMIIKSMLEAGIMNEVQKNEIGTPQGGIISPLLANVYLDKFDNWITREWEEKRTKHQYSTASKRNRALRNGGDRFKPAYLIRYADDWILITNSKRNAEKWKYRIAKYLKSNLKLDLSEDKTHITNIKKKPIRFLGFTFKVIKGKSRSGYINLMRVN
ncbi:group II intron reverse transcriptase/maturase [Desertibacillus haloalkaliphilus]|uniref:group II intron reverse transcriptase/maturase n=1 Tax=Desertibacillus haloalkaliphilus TaxID=1328930 RepID=UPI001FE731DE|nr:group II intron reverse transcriptase/maturase [Desertibacillus haloalkaliphilus]